MIGTADQRERGGSKAIALAVDPEGLASAAFTGSTIDMIEAHTWEDLDAATQFLRPKIFAGEYDTVVIDSITEVQRGMMRWDLDKQHAHSPQKRDKNVPAQDNYLRTQYMLVDYVKALNSWPCTTIWTAHQMEWEDSEGESRYLPMIHGQKAALAQEVMGYMMIHGNGQFMSSGEEDGEDIRRMWFTNSGPYRARDRTGKLPRFLDSPTIPQIMELVTAKPAAKVSAPFRKTASVGKRPIRKAR